MIRLGSNVKLLSPDEIHDEGEPLEQAIQKSVVPLSTEKKIYHFRNKVSGATVDFATDEAGAKSKLNQLGVNNWEIITDQENKENKPKMMSDKGAIEKEEKPEEETTEEETKAKELNSKIIPDVKIEDTKKNL